MPGNRFFIPHSWHKLALVNFQRNSDSIKSVPWILFQGGLSYKYLGISFWSRLKQCIVDREIF